MSIRIATGILRLPVSLRNAMCQSIIFDAVKFIIQSLAPPTIDDAVAYLAALCSSSSRHAILMHLGFPGSTQSMGGGRIRSGWNIGTPNIRFPDN